jgi:Transposase DDE domain
MSIDEFIINVYCLIAEKFHDIVGDTSLRMRGESPALTDCEIITMLMVGEYLGFGSDKKIWRYFKEHWHDWFPKISCRTSFSRQSANLYLIQEKIHQSLSNILSNNKDLFLFDGFPIPICNPKRFTSRNPFSGIGAFGFCAAKDEHYFGFKGHIIITSCGITKACAVAPANIDERDMLLEISEGLTGDIIADKGLIRPELTQNLANRALYLHTPLRDNMYDSRPKEFINKIMNIRRLVETVIGQLTDRFKIQAIKAKDMWHLMAKIKRKILAHTVCIAINKIINPNNYLQIDKILC